MPPLQASEGDARIYRHIQVSGIRALDLSPKPQLAVWEDPKPKKANYRGIYAF